MLEAGAKKSATFSSDTMDDIRNWLREEAKKGWFLDEADEPVDVLDVVIHFVYTGEDYTNRQRATGKLKDQFDRIDEFLVRIHDIREKVKVAAATRSEPQPEIMRAKKGGKK